MVGITEISAGLSSLNAAKTILQGLTAIRDGAMLNEAKIGLQSAILDAQGGLFAAQQEQAAAADREAKLKEEIVRLKDWSRERERYELIGIDGHAFVYMQKAGMRSAEPPHWLCPRCFNDRKKSILQAQARTQGEPTRIWSCPSCKTALAAHWSRKPEYTEIVEAFQHAPSASS